MGNFGLLAKVSMNPIGMGRWRGPFPTQPDWGLGGGLAPTPKAPSPAQSLIIDARGKFLTQSSLPRHRVVTVNVTCVTPSTVLLTRFFKRQQ